MKTRWWLFALRLGLGIVFILASVSKLPVLSQFVTEVAGYNLLPYTLARLYAMVLPRVELVTGCALILGIFIPLALATSILMTLSFTIANMYALHMGINDSCGCFGQLIPLSHTVSLIVDAIMILAAATLLFFKNQTASVGISTLISTSSSGVPAKRQSLVQKISQLAILVAIVLATGLPLSSGDTASPIYQEIDSSLEQGKPVFLFFYLEGCGECEKQKPIIEDLRVAYQDSLSFIPIEYEKEADIAVEFEVTSVPTMLLITGKQDGDYTVSQRFSHLTNKFSLQRGLYESSLAHTICSKYGPIAEFSAMPTSGYAPMKVNFTDSSLAFIEWPSDFRWSWDFDDDQIIDSMLRHPSYVYEKPGTYTVSLTLGGPCGSSTIRKMDYVSVAPGGESRCPVDFFAEPTIVDAGAPVQFVGKSDSRVISWLWDFDSDGKIDSTEDNPVHTYNTDGTYSVTLTIKTADCENRVIKQGYVKVMGCPCGG